MRASEEAKGCGCKPSEDLLRRIFGDGTRKDGAIFDDRLRWIRSGAGGIPKFLGLSMAAGRALVSTQQHSATIPNLFDYANAFVSVAMVVRIYAWLR
jgi:hypothetical protein